MPNCTRIKNNPYKICIGDLRYPLIIYSRTKNATNSSNPEPTITLTTIATVYAMQKSIKGDQIFNGTDIVGQITDAFFFRYNPNLEIDLTNIVDYGGELYTVEEVNLSLEGRKQFGSIKCSKRGIDTLKVNLLSVDDQ